MAASLLAKPFVGQTAALSRRTAQPVRPRGPSAVLATTRPNWLPGADLPQHLDGSLAGDYGFDPLLLGTDPDRLKWFVAAERYNGQWAMMAVVGILGQELLGVSPKWFEAGAKEYPIPPLPLLGIEFILFGFLELKRYQGWKRTGSSGVVDTFPFDPAGMNSDSMATKEIKNGRLAMVAFVGFAVQALVTRQGPIECLTSHLSNPFQNNIIGSVLNLPNVIGK